MKKREMSYECTTPIFSAITQKPTTEDIVTLTFETISISEKPSRTFFKTLKWFIPGLIRTRYVGPRSMTQVKLF